MIKFKVPKNPAWKVQVINSFTDTNRPLFVRVTRRKDNHSLDVSLYDLYEHNYPEFLDNAPMYVQSVVSALLDYRGGYTLQQVNDLKRLEC